MSDKPAPQQIDDIIKQYGGWKGTLLAELRRVIQGADPTITEEVKWKMQSRPEGLPVWSQQGILCFAETWTDNIKLLFPMGAQLKDPQQLFNARLKSKTIRAIEFHEGDAVETAALRALVREALELNAS
jgi:hypothetical protein